MKNRYYIILLVILFAVSNIARAQTYLINAANNGTTINTCSGNIYDSGGAGGDYGNNENFTVTFCSNMPGASVIVNVVSFNTENNYDYLYIYDGPNAGSPQLVQASGSPSIQGNTYESTGTCLTIRFTSDGSVVRPGFNLAISCGLPCQDFTIDMVSTTPVFDTDSLWLDACMGQNVTFTAQGTYPNNYTDYDQSDATTNWIWSVVSGNSSTDYPGVGQTTFNHTFTDPGGYFINLMAVDINNCFATLAEQYRVRISLPPTFGTLTIDQTEVCPCEPVNVTGSVTPNTWTMSITDTQIVQECIDDFVGVVQSYCWTVSAFQPNQTIQTGTDLESVCMNIEHSFMGDLYIYVQCPNGQQANIHQYYNCNGAYLGLPDHADNCNPGVGWDYCWSMNNTVPHTNICNSGSSIPAGNYLPMGSFNDLIGCPINGEWCIIIIDDWNIDDGTLFSVDLNFNESIIPADVWSITMEYEDSGLVWTGDGVNPNSGGNATFNPCTSGTQTFSFEVTDNFGCTYNETVSVVVLPIEDPTCCTMPVAYAGEDSHVCTNAFTFNATLLQGNTGSWSLVSGPGNAVFTNPNSPNASVNVDAWGEYVFAWTEQNLSPACSDTDSITVEFYPIPTTTFTYTPILCFGNQTTINYIGNVGPAATYIWDFDSGQALGSGQGPFNVSWTESGIHSVRLTVSANGCTSGDTTVNIFNPPALTYVLQTSNDPCYQSCGGSAQVAVNGGTPPYSYSWTPGAPDGNPVYNNLCAGSYDLLITDNNGCFQGENFTITHPDPLVIIDTVVTHVQCYANAEGAILIEAFGGTGHISYIWSDGGPDTHERTDLIAGNYCVTVIDENDCNITMCFVITQPDELLAVISADIAVCEGEQVNVQMQAYGGTLPYTYFWDREDGEGFVIGGSTIIEIPLITTNYSSYVLDGNGCITDTLQMTVTVSPKLRIDSILLTHNRCHNSCDGRAQLVLQGGIPPLQYSWGSANHIFEGLCAGPYTITVTDLIGCTVMSNYVITQPPPLSYSADVTPATCFGYDDGRAAIHVQGGTPPYNYIWANGFTESELITVAGTYTVTVTDSQDCRLITSFTINQPTEIITTPVSNRTICIGGSTTLVAQATGGTPYYDFRWTGSDGSVYPVNTATVSPAQNTVYTLIVTDSLGCTSEPRVVNVNIHPALDILTVVTSYDTICQGDPAIIQVDAIGGNGGPYFMTLQDGTVVSSPFTIYPQETMYYYITLYDNCGSPPDRDSIKITVRPKPGNLFQADKVKGCPPFTVNFSELTPNTGQTYLWNFGDNGFAEVKNPSYTYRESGVYSVTLEVRDHFGCKNRKTRENMITVHKNPVANFIPEPEFVSMVNSEIHFINKSLDAMYYYWFFGDGDSSNFSSPRHVFPNIGEYEVILIAESYHGCRDTISRTILVQNEYTFYAPTSFTPNGDGVNDCFRVCGNGIDKSNFRLNVFDRWGNRVFETTKFKLDVNCEACGEGSWDGTNNGSRIKGDEVLTNGLYFWYCDFKDGTGTMHSKSGSVYLVR